MNNFSKFLHREVNPKSRIPILLITLATLWLTFILPLGLFIIANFGAEMTETPCIPLPLCHGAYHIYLALLLFLIEPPICMFWIALQLGKSLMTSGVKTAVSVVIVVIALFWLVLDVLVFPLSMFSYSFKNIDLELQQINLLLSAIFYINPILMLIYACYLDRAKPRIAGISD